jgi:hypothetical protein
VFQVCQLFSLSKTQLLRLCGACIPKSFCFVSDALWFALLAKRQNRCKVANGLRFCPETLEFTLLHFVLFHYH